MGYTATYQCIAPGNGHTTKWNGSKFNCPPGNNRIILRHRHVNFTHQKIDGTYGYCDGFFGQILPMEGDNNQYLSQLMVNVTSKLNGTTIKCVHENVTNNMRSEIGQAQLTLTTGSYNYYIIIICYQYYYIL